MAEKKQARKQRPETTLHDHFAELVMDKTPDHGIQAFAQHVGIVFPSKPDAWWPTFLAHYLTRDDANARVDEARFATDLATFPPIAARVAELRRGAT